jgi:hypothetical protein
MIEGKKKEGMIKGGKDRASQKEGKGSRLKGRGTRMFCTAHLHLMDCD